MKVGKHTGPRPPKGGMWWWKVGNRGRARLGEEEETVKKTIGPGQLACFVSKNFKNLNLIGNRPRADSPIKPKGSISLAIGPDLNEGRGRNV